MNWWWATVLGPIVLVGVIAYATSRARKLTEREASEQADAVDRVYQSPEFRKSETQGDNASH